MMIDYAYLTTLPSLARVRKNARQWDFFCWLLSQADEKGYAEVSVREYAAMKGIAHSTIQGWLISANFRPIIESTKMGKYTLVYFCKYASYVQKDGQSSAKVRPILGQSSANERPLAEKTEEKFPPAPPLKEENVRSEVATLQKKEKKAAGATFVPVESFEKRREHFWKDCEHCWHLHKDWPLEAVKSFYFFWSQPTQDGIYMKFELEQTFGLPHRMRSYFKHGHWLDAVGAAKLEAIKARGGNKAKTPTTAEIKRKEAELEAEKQEHERRARERIQQAMNSRSHEEAMLDPQYWLAMDVNNPDTLYRAQRDPRHLEAYKKAVEIAKRKENK